MSFSLDRAEAGHRRGMLHTKAGDVATPFFMPDATRASIRGILRTELEMIGIGPMVVNTYHLMLQPGSEFIRNANGVHSFMNWSGPLLSDSGGYQVYSLIHRNPELGRITEDGAEFRSVLNGSKHLLTPEQAIAIQFDLGVDMMVVLDDPRPNDVPHEEMEASVERTIRWAKRCRKEFDRQVAAREMNDDSRPLLFAVVQGGASVELRRKCAAALTEIGFDGYGFGGRHIDAEGNFLEEVVAETATAIPNDAPRFALGIGTPEDIVRCYALGWDMFDCVIPTREGRHGRLFRWESQDTKHNMFAGEAGIQNTSIADFYETINISNEQYKEDFMPVDKDCDCELCKNYSKAYLRHLFLVEDPLAGRLATLHNLRFYMRLMGLLREGE